MKKSALICAIAILLSQWIVTESCQAQRRMGSGQQSMAMLLGLEEVQKELKMSDEQVEEAKTLIEDLQQKMREKFEGAQDMSREEILELREELQQELRSAEKELLGDVLNEDQLKRLKQLMVQQMGPRALDDPEIAEALDISDEQGDKIAQIMADSRDKMMEKFQELRENGDRDAIRAAMEEFQSKLTEELLGVLSDDQKKKWEEMNGEKFDFPRMSRQRDRGGRTDF